MQVNSITAPTFKAQIPKRVKEVLSNEAIAKGGNAYEKYVTQSRLIEKWGNDTSTISYVEKQQRPSSISFIDKLKDNTPQKVLILVDSYLAPFRQGKLPQKDSLLDSFMAITEKDILKAESSLVI